MKYNLRFFGAGPVNLQLNLAGMYIYIYIYTYMYPYVYIYVYTYICIHVLLFGR